MGRPACLSFAPRSHGYDRHLFQYPPVLPAETRSRRSRALCIAWTLHAEPTNITCRTSPPGTMSESRIGKNLNHIVLYR